jgi:hypothetical protein
MAGVAAMPRLVRKAGLGAGRAGHVVFAVGETARGEANATGAV